MRTDLGKSGVRVMGAWSSATAYEKNDIVSNGGSSYISIQSVPAGTALSNSSYWLMIAEKGDKGDKGDTGATGATGATGNGISSVEVEETSVVGNVHTYTLTISMTDGTSEVFEYEVTDGAVTSVNGRTGAVEGLAEEEDLIKAFPNDTASGDIASFPDGAEMPVKGMKINVEPYQNLNGYDSPWVGGAGVNIIGNFGLRESVSGGGGEITITKGSDGSTYTFSGSTTALRDMYILGPSNSGYDTDAGDYYLYSNIDASINEGENIFYISILGTDSTTRYVGVGGTGRESWAITIASGEKVKGIFIRVASGVNVTGKIVTPMLVKGTTAPTSYSPYENICPIYPANGKNLFNGKFIDGNNYIDATSGSAVNATSTPEYRCTDYIDCSAWQGQNITLNHGPRGSSTGIAFYDSSKVYISGIANQSATAGTPRIYLVPSTAYYLRFTTIVDYVDDCQLELGNTATPYVPYRAFGMTRTGKNLLPQSSIFKGLLGGANFVIENQTSTVYRTAIIKLPKGSWTFTFPVNVLLTRLVKDGTYSVITNSNINTYTINTTTDGWVGLSWRDYTSSSTNWNDSSVTQLEKGSASTGIEPYTGERYYSRDYNMWDEEWEVGNIDNTTGQNAVSANCIRSKNYIPCEPNTKYYTNGFITGNTGIYEIYFYGSDKTFLHEMANTNSFTTSANAHFMRFRCSNAYGTTYKNDIIFNYSNPSQVGYGGVLDVDTGLLTVTHAIANVDLGSISSWTQNTKTKNKYLSNAFPEVVRGGNYGASSPKFISNILQYKYNTLDQVHWYCSNNSESIDIYVPIDFDVTGVTGQFVAELITPVQYQLTPTQVKTLLGYNNIWTDSGTVEVNYLADTSLYIQKLTGSTEEDMIANANIENGKYFLVNNELFLSTSAIAQGASIVVGTNCIKTNLADALNALNS